MGDVTFLFCKKISKWALFKYLIMCGERLDFSHAALLIDGWVYESIFPLSKKSPLGGWLLTYEIVETYKFEVPLENVDLIKLDCEELMGKRYSQFQIVLVALSLLSKSIENYFSRIKWNGRKFLICTELAGDIAFNHFDISFGGEQIDNLGLRELRDGIRDKARL